MAEIALNVQFSKKKMKNGHCLINRSHMLSI